MPTMDDIVLAYMDKTTYDYALGSMEAKVSVYNSEEALREEKDCLDECGIVEVEIRLSRVVQEENYYEDELNT